MVLFVWVGAFFGSRCALPSWKKSRLRWWPRIA